MRPRKILISAGESSGDLYASELVRALRRFYPDTEFFGCAGSRMQAEGVRPVVDASALAVVGLVEVITHIPRIYGEFRKLVQTAQAERPDLAILTDSPDFHLRLATKLRHINIPVIYLIAPQVWAWRQGRVRRMRRDLAKLLCIFPFEKDWFETRGVPTEYIGHPLPRIVRPRLSRGAFFQKLGLDVSHPTITLLPGSRVGEVARHLPYLVEAATVLARDGFNLVLAVPPGFSELAGASFFKERIGGSSIQVIEGDTWDAVAHADLVLAASGTVTVEAALLGAPMITFYRVTGLSWLLGRFLVRVPYYSMVNLVAGRAVVPELMQEQMTGANLAQAARRLWADPEERARMKADLAEVAARLTTAEDPMERAALSIAEYWNKELGHGS